MGQFFCLKNVNRQQNSDSPVSGELALCFFGHWLLVSADYEQGKPPDLKRYLLHASWCIPYLTTA